MAEEGATPVIRTANDDDLDWVVRWHGQLYLEELGWGHRFEGFVADIVASFRRGHDEAAERCWVAELDGERVGSVLLARESDEVAKLRILLVEPELRCRGIGTMLVDRCLAFAHRAGYRRVTLWTDSGLHPARRLYQRKGFRKVSEVPHDLYGEGLVAETWELDL